MAEDYKKMIVFVLPALGNARSRLRIEALKQEGAEVEILGFDRDMYRGAPYNDPVTNLGSLLHGKYFLRLVIYFKALLRIRKHCKRTQVVYVLGLDLAMLAWLALLKRRNAVRLVLEVQDIRSVLLKEGINAWISRTIEKFIVPRVDTLVVTSRAYVDCYYFKVAKINPSSFYVIENKIDDTPVMKYQRIAAASYLKEDTVVIIGYFGLFRCQQSLDIILATANAAQGRVKFYLRGVFHNTEGYKDLVIDNPFIEYGGEYRSPDELGSIYGKVDLVWACYPYERKSQGNWLWARTNRFYEACYFGRPVITATGTQDGKVADEKGIGICLDLSDFKSSMDALLNIRVDDLDNWRRNILSMDEKDYIHGMEHKLLLQNIYN